MQRAVFDRSIIDGYRTSKTESIAVTAHGRRMFAGTSDGAIVVYDCRPDTVGSTSKGTLPFAVLKFCFKLANLSVFRIFVHGCGHDSEAQGKEALQRSDCS